MNNLLFFFKKYEERLDVFNILLARKQAEVAV